MLDSSFSASRRYSPMKFANPHNNSMIISSPQKHKRLNTNSFYCHYSNAIYMGGVDCFKKNGSGILLLDSGACCITNHSHDNMVDYNIVFRDKSITFMSIKTNKTRYVSYRTGPYLVTAHYSERGSAQGTGFLVDYNQNKLYKLAYYNSKIDKKQQILQKRVLDNIFNHSDLSDIIEDKNHLKGLKLKFGNQQIRSQVNQSTYQISLKTGSQKKKALNGLSFRVQIKNTPKQFDVILIERGYYNQGKMDNFGQKHFQNGNYYFGGFKNGQFNSYGMLIHPRQRKWTYGIHKYGQIKQLLDSSVNSQQKISEVMKKIHEVQDSFIKNTIKITPTAGELSTIVKNFIQAQESEPIVDSVNAHKKKSDNLRIIRDSFVENQLKENTQDIIKYELNNKYKEKIKKSQHFVTQQTRDDSRCKNKSQLIKNSSYHKLNVANKSKSKQKSNQKSNKKLQTNSSKQKINYYKAQGQEARGKRKKQDAKKLTKQNQQYKIKISTPTKYINKTPTKKQKQNLKVIQEQARSPRQNSVITNIDDNRSSSKPKKQFSTAESYKRNPHQLKHSFENNNEIYSNNVHYPPNYTYQSFYQPHYLHRLQDLQYEQMMISSLYQNARILEHERALNIYRDRYFPLDHGIQANRDRNFLKGNRHFKYVDDENDESNQAHPTNINQYHRSSYKK